MDIWDSPVKAGYMGINYNQVKGGREGTFEYCAGSESVTRYVKERLFEFPDSVLDEKLYIYGSF